MNERWKQIERLYHTALEHEATSRKAFLEQACAGDEELRHEVSALLAYDGQPASFIESPVLERAARELVDESFSDVQTDPPVNAPAPSQIGAYQILSPLGRGGMGEIWLAHDTRLGRKVAIKLLPAKFMTDTKWGRRFEREARAASALNHPNIITVYEIGETEDRRFIVMEYVEGETLRQRMLSAPEQRIRLTEALEMAAQVANALQAAHEAGITHRDIKPENVIVRKDGLVKVLDFGLAKLTEKAGRAENALPTPSNLPLDSISGSTAPGVVMGTASYMSPEQARGEQMDHRTDIFSLGIMLYELLAGRRPFGGKTASDVLTAVLTSEPVSLVEIVPKIPATLWRIVRRCLEKQPEKRFQSAGDLAFALEELNTPSGVISGAEPATTTQKQLPAKASLPDRLTRGRRGWSLAAASATLILIALVLAVIHLLELPDERLSVSFTFRLPNNWGFRWHDAPALSPDGKYIVYSALPVMAQGRNDDSLWLRRLDSSEAKPLPGTQGGLSPFWSPDSQFVAFLANGRLRKVDVSGGSALTICEVSDSAPGSWNRDGLILFSTGPRLSRIAAAGGQATQLNPFADDEVGQYNPRFLPDGRHFLYFSRNRNAKNDGIYVASLDPGAKRKLILEGAVLAVYVAPGYLLFVEEQTLIAQRFDLKRLELMGEPVRIAEHVASYISSGMSLPFAAFSVSENGVLAWKVRASEPNKTQLAWYDRSGKRLGTVGDTAEYSGPSFSPGEDRLVVAIADPRNRMRDLWIMQPSLGTSSRLTFDPNDDFNPRWTPDGKWIIFTSTQNGARNIYRKLADGTGEVEPLITSEESLHVEDISPDGRFLLFNSYLSPQTEPDLGVLSLVGDRKRTSFLSTPFREDQARFSPNGRWVAYRSNEADGQRIFVRNFMQTGSDTGGKWQISTKIGSQPQWGEHGRELFYIEGNTLMAVDVNTDGASFSAGAPKPLFSINIEADERRNRYIATKDGQRFLVVLRAETAVEDTIAAQVNWQAALKQ